MLQSLHVLFHIPLRLECFLCFVPIHHVLELLHIGLFSIWVGLCYTGKSHVLSTHTTLMASLPQQAEEDWPQVSTPHLYSPSHSMVTSLLLLLVVSSHQHGSLMICYILVLYVLVYFSHVCQSRSLRHMSSASQISHAGDVNNGSSKSQMSWIVSLLELHDSAMYAVTLPSHHHPLSLNIWLTHQLECSVAHHGI
jgi:Na+/melibiose symporter-like transporter